MEVLDIVSNATIHHLLPIYQVCLNLIFPLYNYLVYQVASQNLQHFKTILIILIKIVNLVMRLILIVCNA